MPADLDGTRGNASGNRGLELTTSSSSSNDDDDDENKKVLDSPCHCVLPGTNPSDREGGVSVPGSVNSCCFKDFFVLKISTTAGRCGKPNHRSSNSVCCVQPLYRGTVASALDHGKAMGNAFGLGVSHADLSGWYSVAKCRRPGRFLACNS